MTTPATLTPSQLNALARDLLEGAFPLIWVEGELAGLSRPASGHLYFTLKDARAQVRCAMFRPRTQWLRTSPRDGMQVLLRARLTLYEPRGDYQLVVEHLEEAGEGALRRAFEALRRQLEAEGLFDPARKQPLPRPLQRLGVITSPGGAAIHDVLSVLRRRFPLIEVDLLPVLVQGKEAPAQIVRMLQRADAAGRYDALLLTRGGGSLEDLQAFNEESVARAIAALRTPLVCAVGHEVDVSIADLVADVRAATPSAAAELLVPDRVELAHRLQHRAVQLAAVWRRRLQRELQRVDGLHQRMQAQRPEARLQRGRERLLALQLRMRGQMRGTLRRCRERPAALAARLKRRHPVAIIQSLRLRADLVLRRQQALHAARQQQRRLQLGAVARALHALSPLATLGRGYALLRGEDGALLTRVEQAHAGQALRARLADGELALRVDAVLPAPGSDESR